MIKDGRIMLLAKKVESGAPFLRLVECLVLRCGVNDSSGGVAGCVSSTGGGDGGVKRQKKVTLDVVVRKRKRPQDVSWKGVGGGRGNRERTEENKSVAKSRLRDEKQASELQIEKPEKQTDGGASNVFGGDGENQCVAQEPKFSSWSQSFRSGKAAAGAEPQKEDKEDKEDKEMHITASFRSVLGLMVDG